MSRTGNGALIALNAIGKQDQILCELDDYEQENSPFRHTHDQFTHYTRFYKSYVRDNPGNTTWPFTDDGVKVGFILNPRISGDLLTNAYVKMSLPAIEDGLWTDNIGRALIQSVEFRVDSVLVEKLTDLELVVRDELFTTERDKAVRNYIQNGKLYKNSMTEEDLLTNPPVLPMSPDHNRSALDLYIDLGFCFNRRHDYKPAPFPLAAVFNQMVYVDIQFRPKSWFTNTTSDVYATRVSLVTEQITVTERERLYIQRNPQKITYKNIEPMVTVQTDENADSFSQVDGPNSSANTVSVQLKSKKRTSTVLWAFQNRRFKTSTASDSINSLLFLNRYNFSSHENFSNINPIEDGYIEPFYGFNERNFPLCSQIRLLYSKTVVEIIYTGSTQETIPSTSVFFRDILSQSRGLFTPVRNIFSYSFEDEPRNPEIGGSYTENLDNYKIEATLINTDQVTSNVYDLHIFTMSYFDLDFENGRLVKKM